MVVGKVESSTLFSDYGEQRRRGGTRRRKNEQSISEAVPAYVRLPVREGSGTLEMIASQAAGRLKKNQFAIWRSDIFLRQHERHPAPPDPIDGERIFVWFCHVEHRRRNSSASFAADIFRSIPGSVANYRTRLLCFILKPPIHRHFRAADRTPKSLMRPICDRSVESVPTVVEWIGGG
jgi:hypothetical protein